MKSRTMFVCLLVTGVWIVADATGAQSVFKWKHLSTTKGDLEKPNEGTQQTSSIVCDIDKDGVNDFVITERTKAPSVVWYRRGSAGWTKYVVDDQPLNIEAGSDFLDIDADGDFDIVCGGDSRSNQVWWWENPCPDFEKNKPWKRRLIKDFGGTKHHDQMFGDFDGDGKTELVFWNQGSCTLYLAEIPAEPRNAKSWQCSAIYRWNNDSEMEQRQTKPYPGFKAINEHEGLAKADIDGDGKLDIIGGGRWFKHVEETKFQENIIDASYAFSRAAAGQLVEGGRPEVVLVVGDGWAPLMMYEWKKTGGQGGTWTAKELIPEVDCGHSLAVLDFDGDGKFDIWVAEMRLGGGNPDAKNLILLGDGKGNFETVEVSSGIANHESKIADLDGDTDYDILDKPYDWQTPRLDIWLNEGRQSQ
jgi:hypothetical protein